MGYIFAKQCDCCHNSNNFRINKTKGCLMAALFYLRNIPLCHIFADDILRPIFPRLECIILVFKLSRVMSAQFYFCLFSKNLHKILQVTLRKQIICLYLHQENKYGICFDK